MSTMPATCFRDRGRRHRPVYSSVSFSLWSKVDNLTLTGTAITGGGNNGANTIIGNAQNNVLNGAGGADILKGAAGNDIYLCRRCRGHCFRDRRRRHRHGLQLGQLLAVVGGRNLTLTGTAITGGGNNGDNTIIGNAQNNVLNGAGGADIMLGAPATTSIYVDDAGDIVSESRRPRHRRVYSASASRCGRRSRTSP